MESWYVSLIMPAVTIATVIFGYLISWDLPKALAGQILLGALLLTVAIWLVNVGMLLRKKFKNSSTVFPILMSIIWTPPMTWLISVIMSIAFNNHDSESFAITVIMITLLSLAALPAAIVGYSVGKK